MISFDKRFSILSSLHSPGGQTLFRPCHHLKVKVKSLSRVRLFVTPWTVAYHTPLSMGFSRQEYWSGLLFPSPEDLPNPGIKPASPALAGVGRWILYHWATREAPDKLPIHCQWCESGKRCRQAISLPDLCGRQFCCIIATKVSFLFFRANFLKE